MNKFIESSFVGLIGLYIIIVLIMIFFFSNSQKEPKDSTGMIIYESIVCSAFITAFIALAMFLVKTSH